MTRGSWIVAVAGALFLAGGALWALTRPVSFGWTAYAPLSEQTFDPTLGGLYVGAATAAVGLGLLGGVVGYTLGRRRPLSRGR
ncbi:hypothetical protein Bcav_4052 [Beutenbergia cavernae DSM 12333]|uniref:Uncharacterized protein n=1 Tax=Beutenbergia cavernae (strain ATCC BAA-8 / DSM 12333 / CCUG 43141 / JCM 11478 / NBRC 16432 / NCIMB 13614 / HKI 0122) TaxID=471853 RepID=C5C5F3_BEUC1|nr:hypothetical protein [Beutenbergia cavernae]ACQ82293.1 hypothetical protein Bcav_4052 [Beutenbergia cavernae DSM 12333]